MSIQPEYDKQDPQPQWEYRLMTWDVFLTLREWAQEVANAEGYPVYLVGSSLWKTCPRDVDVSIIMPVEDFEKRYGKLPETKEELKAYLDRREYWASYMGYVLYAQERIRYYLRVDLKCQPSTWFADRDKLLLAEPNGNVRMRQLAEVKPPIRSEGSAEE